MELGIAGRSTFIGGGTRGIGLAIAQELAGEGAKVFVASRNQDNVTAAIKSIRDAGGVAEGCSADCADRVDLARAIAASRSAHGAPLIAVMLPDATIRSNFVDGNDALFAEGQRRIILPLAQMTRALMPEMQEAGWGRIISIGSMSVRAVHRNVAMTVPDTYRLGAVGLVKTLSDELGPYGITVNTVAPGSVLTENARAFFTNVARETNVDFDTLMQQRSAAIPMRRQGRPDDIAGVCAFLCSERGGYVTGQTWLVDGGQTAAPI